MAKYSTGGSSRDGGGSSCELCGASTDRLRTANIAGAQLDVCAECAPHADTAHKDKKRTKNKEYTESDRKRRAARNAARANVWNGDSSRWESEGTNYDDDPLPYLVKGYGSRLAEARQDAGLQRDELAAELGVREKDLLAVEQGRATQAGVGGGLIAALEDRLDVTLAE